MTEDTLKNLPIKLADKAYDDLRPVVTQAVGSVVYVLELADKLIHAPETAIRKMPAVYGKCCEAFRRFREEIPEEFQQEPQSSIAYSVVQNIPGADGATEIQEMFAKLLATASDSRVSHRIHPSFSRIIGDLSPIDALYVNEAAAFADETYFTNSSLEAVLPKYALELFDSSIANLVRLGIIMPVTQTGESPLKIRSALPPAYLDGLEELGQRVDEMRSQLDQVLYTVEDIGALNGHRFTSLGVAFVECCVKSFTKCKSTGRKARPSKSSTKPQTQKTP